jgi:peroxin-2
MMHATDEGENEMGWECLRCGQGVKGAERYVVDVDMSVGSEISGSEYEFSSDLDMDVTDMSASVGSYSESGLSDDY